MSNQRSYVGNNRFQHFAFDYKKRVRKMTDVKEEEK